MTAYNLKPPFKCPVTISKGNLHSRPPGVIEKLYSSLINQFKLGYCLRSFGTILHVEIFNVAPVFVSLPFLNFIQFLTYLHILQSH